MYKFWIIGLVLAMLEGNFLNWWIIKNMKNIVVSGFQKFQG